MNCITIVSVFAMSATIGSAAVATAQLPPTPPARPAPASLPTPASEPTPASRPAPPARADFDYRWELRDTPTPRPSVYRLDDMRLYSDRIATAVAPIAQPRITTSVDARAYGVATNVDVATTFSNNFAISTNPDFAYSPQWQQDADPADSLYRVAYDAMNRGEWRRAADMFAQVSSKYPKSRRIMAATYYEAFMHYRIGTTEELQTALRVLNDRSKLAATNNVSNSTTTQQEIASLTTRIRGALAARGDTEAARQLGADAQKSGCDSEDVQVKSEALSALAQADAAAATPMLKRVLEKRDPCLLELRRRSLSILLRRGDTAATSAAISVARATDEALSLRTDAVSYLSRLPGDNAISTLEELLRNSTDADVQRAAIRALSNTENARARQTLRALIERNDVSERLREEAVNTMDRSNGTGRPEDATYLRGVYSKLQPERVKIAALSAISRVPGAENEQFVLRVARDPSESSEVRAGAVSRMYRIPGISISDISKLYDAAESRSLREQLISVLSQRKEPETIDKLIEIVKTGTDPRLKSQAMNALIKKDDPRAKKLLSEIVGN